jgi:hypothetical protein
MRFLGAFILVLAFTASAQAGGSVDWSAYIESGPSQPLVRTQGPSKSEAAPAKTSRPRIARAGKAKASKAKGKAKVKARATKKTRRK